MHRVFRPLKKGDTLRCAYLYGDGHVVCKFERYQNDIKVRSEYVQIAQSIGVVCHFAGRIVFHDGAALVAFAYLPRPAINAHAHTATEKAYLFVSSDIGSISLHEPGPFHVQIDDPADPHDIAESFSSDPENRWAGLDVARVYRNDTSKAA